MQSDQFWFSKDWVFFFFLGLVMFHAKPRRGPNKWGWLITLKTHEGQWVPQQGAMDRELIAEERWQRCASLPSRSLGASPGWYCLHLALKGKENFTRRSACNLKKKIKKTYTLIYKSHSLVPWNNATQFGFCLNNLFVTIGKTTQTNSPFTQKLFLISVRRKKQILLFSMKY